MTLAVGAPALAATPRFSAGERAQAHRLLAPANRFYRSETKRELARQVKLVNQVSTRVGRCEQPYRKELMPQNAGSKYEKLSMLWSNSTGMQVYQADVAPYRKHLAVLVNAWKTIRLRNRPMRHFARAMSNELNYTLSSAPMNACAFARAIGRHHFSYRWAKQSSWGVATTQWIARMEKDAERANGFWTRALAGRMPFTQKQLNRLANVPGIFG